jgi:hypothetical protein
MMKNFYPLPIHLYLLKARANPDRYFSFRGFNPKSVRSVFDLPPYLVMGWLESDSFQLTNGSWSATWRGRHGGSWLKMEYDKYRAEYVVSQSWHGVDGGVATYRHHVPLATVISQALNYSFPKSWDLRAKEEFEGRYALEYFPRQSQAPDFFGLPGGFFSTIAVPVHVNQITRFVEDLSNLFGIDKFIAPVSVEMHRVRQVVNYIEGKAAVDKLGVTNLFIPSYFETGLLPDTQPVYEEAANDSAAWTLRRNVYVVCIEVSFALLDLVLEELQKHTELLTALHSSAAAAKDFAMRPFVMQAGVDAVGGQISFWDRDKTTRVLWDFKECSHGLRDIAGYAHPLTSVERDGAISVIVAQSNVQGEMIKSAMERATQ